VNYCHVAVVSTDPPEICAAFRAGLGASAIAFLSDHERRAIRELDIVEETAPGFKHGRVAVPYTFSLAPDLPSTGSTTAGGMSGDPPSRSSARISAPSCGPVVLTTNTAGLAQPDPGLAPCQPKSGRGREGSRRSSSPELDMGEPERL
jgi:hypothetical protein